MDQGDYFYPNEDGDFEETNCEEVWREEMARKDADLFQWIEEFMESEEYAEHLKRKKKRKNKKTQVKEELLDKVDKSNILDDLETRQRSYTYLKSAQKKIKCKEVTIKQESGINAIRDKIFEARQKYLSKHGEKSYLQRNDREAIITILKEQYGIDLPWLTPTSKLIDRVIYVRRKKSQARERKRRNTTAIVEKLLNELKYEKAQKEKKEKVWDYKKSKGKIVEGLEITGTQVTFHERPEPEPLIEEALEEQEEEEALNLDVLPEDWKKKSKDDKISPESENAGKKKDDKGKAGKEKDKKQDKKKDKTDKSSKSKGKGEIKVVIPVPPITNFRKKIEPEKWEISKLLKDVDKLQEYLFEQRSYEVEQLMQDTLVYEEDREMEANPSKIIFKNFINGHNYQINVHLTSTSSYTKKLRFDKIIWNADVDDDLLLEVESIGIQKLITGISISFYLRFNPETLQKSTEAKIVFLTYKPNTVNYRQYVLYVVCTPFCSEITISPTVISFEEIPIWRAQKLIEKRESYKTLKITNSGSKECRIVITKIFNPITVEHEWRNIISILSIDDSNSQKITSSDLSLKDVREDRFPRNLVQECVENSFNSFRFDRMVFNVAGNSEKIIKIWLRNCQDTGFLVETYSLSVYERYPDEQLYCIGNQDLVVNAELTGHFLQLMPDLLDFEVCAFDSVYQLSFQIFNPTNRPHNVKIKLPISMRDYLTCTSSNITVQAGKDQKVHLKFTPRSDFANYNKKFYDTENDLFEFPVYVIVYTNNFEDTPPMIIDTFVVLTKPLGLVLIPQFGENVSDLEDEYLLDLGQCSTNEAIFTTFKIQNTSFVPQHYAFVDLPECITIQPNFGLGYLQPMEGKKLLLYFQPTKEDLQNLPLDDFEPYTVLFSISANTVKNLGSLKKKFNEKMLKHKLKKMEQIIKNPPKVNQQLKEDIETMCSVLRSNSDILYPEQSNISSSTTTTNIQPDQPTHKATISPIQPERINENEISHTQIEEKVVTVIHYDDTSEIGINSLINSEDFFEDDVFDAKHPSNRMWLRATIKMNFCEFSHQYVMFPDTPCGSYSVVSVELKFVKKFKNCSAKFEIIGDCQEIIVEPNVGELIHGEKVKIYLIARPETPQRVIEEKAVALKVAEAIEAKRRDFEKKRNAKNTPDPNAKNDKKTDKNDKKGKGKPPEADKKKNSGTKTLEIGEGDNNLKQVEEIMPEFVVDEKDIVYGYFDYYPAEMCVWRNLEPYFIETEFCCKITYTNEEIEFSTEKLYLKAKCQVVQPNFIHDLNIQEIDFGNVAIGMSQTKCLTLQNIQRRCISPKINPLNPKGCFSTLELGNVSILPEFLLKIPITYTPQTEDDNEDIEFLEIVCDQTTYDLILKGKGVFPILIFKPQFTVSRIESGSDCTFEIANITDCPVEITFTKTCELDGLIKDNPEASKQGDTTSKTPEKPDKSKKETIKKRPNFSEDLMDDEIYSLQNCFEERSEKLPTLFRVTSGPASGDVFVIPAMGKSVFKIKFGLVVEETGGKKEKKKDTKKKSGGKISYHVAKYVVTLGKREFLKEFIFVGCLSQ